VEGVEAQTLPKLDDFANEIAKSQSSLFIEDTEKHSEISSFARQHQIRAFATLPLTIADAQGIPVTVGVLFVNFKSPHSFPEDEQELLGHLANQASVAIALTNAQTAALAQVQLAALGTAAGTLQHRLGNTINVILPAVLRLRRRLNDDPTSEEILNAIERNALFATEVIRRMQTPLQREEFARTNLNSLLREAIQKCIQENRYPGISVLVSRTPQSDYHPPQPHIMITTELEDELPETYASVGQMTEVFRVLVENAIKAIHPEPGFVTVTSKLAQDRLGKFVEITVNDTGKGIDEKTRAKLFKQPVPRQEFGEGAGLGLWLCHIIVRSHQGAIRLHASELDKGSTFLVRLPILTQPPSTYSTYMGVEL
jgi:signal transduction histidine kinase